MLVHPGAFDVGPVAEHPADERPHFGRDVFFRHALSLHKGLIHRLDGLFGGGQGTVVLADPFIADLVRMAVDHGLLFPGGLHGRRIELHAPDGRCVGAAPVEIDAAVVVDEKIGIPEGEAAFDLLIRPVQDILRAPAVAVIVPARSAEVHVPAHHPYVRRVIIEGQTLRQTAVFPVYEVVGDPDAERHGRENVIAALKADHRRIRRLAADLKRPALAGILVELVAVADVERITVILHSDDLPS